MGIHFYLAICITEPKSMIECRFMGGALKFGQAYIHLNGTHDDTFYECPRQLSSRFSLNLMTKLSAVYNCKVLSFSPQKTFIMFIHYLKPSKATGRAKWECCRAWIKDGMALRSLLPNGNFISISIPLRIKKLMATVDYFPLASDFSSFLPLPRRC